MRKLVLTIVISSTLVLGGWAPGASASVRQDSPITLKGKVNDKAHKTVKGDSLALEIDNYYFKPTFVKAPVGTTLEITLQNEGRLPHTFTIASEGIDEELAPGKAKTVSVTVGSKALRFYCRFHKGKGMQGAVYSKTGSAVEGGGGSSSGSGGGSGSKNDQPYDY